MLTWYHSNGTDAGNRGKPLVPLITYWVTRGLTFQKLLFQSFPKACSGSWKEKRSGSLLSSGLSSEGKTLVGMLSADDWALVDYRGLWNVVSVRVFLPHTIITENMNHSSEVKWCPGKLQPKQFLFCFISGEHILTQPLSLAHLHKSCEGAEALVSQWKSAVTVLDHPDSCVGVKSTSDQMSFWVESALPQIPTAAQTCFRKSSRNLCVNTRRTDARVLYPHCESNGWILLFRNIHWKAFVSACTCMR